MTNNHPEKIIDLIALIGFGEAGQAFASGWLRSNNNNTVVAYDLKTGSKDASVAAAKRQDYINASVIGCSNCGDVVNGADLVFSLVTPEQALVAAREAAAHIGKNRFYFDCNSCAPDTKRQAAAVVSKAGGRYVDVAVMGPVGPVLENIPLLISGGNAADALPLLQHLGMNTTLLAGEVGRASSVKMIRSIMMKGLEALALECVLSARVSGVENEVLDSLEQTYPGFGWVERSAHMLERAMTHGIRRAEELREVAKTVSHLGIPNDMALAIIEWQQRTGELDLTATGVNYRDHADQLLAALKKSEWREQ